MTSNSLPDDKVVRFEEIRGDASLVRVFFENHDSLDVPLKTVIDYGVKVGAPVSGGVLAELERQGVRALFRNKALNYLRHRPRTRYELHTYLRKHECDENAAADIVDELQQLHYLDDNVYSKQFVEAKGNRHSRREILWKLKQRGVSSTVSASAVDEVESYDEYLVAKELAEKRWSRKQAVERGKMRDSIGAFLQRKGFPTSTIYRVLEEVERELGDGMDIS